MTTASSRHLYLVRHGDAIDSGDLSAAGRRQAELVGERLLRTPLSDIQHGPLPRARQTAHLVSAKLGNLPMVASELAGDYVPYRPSREEIPQQYAAFLDDIEGPVTERAERAAAASPGSLRGRRRTRVSSS